MKTTLSVILPAYNESGNIPVVVGSVMKAMASMVDDYEIIVVDDGSTDSTGAVAGSLTKNGKVRVIHHTHNRGMGAAVRTGFKQARFELVIDIPADNQFDPLDIEALLKKNKETDADIVVGKRPKVKKPLMRRFYSNTNRMLLSLLYGLRIEDPTWVKLFKKNVFNTIKIEADGFFWESEVLVKAKIAGLKIVSQEVGMHPRLLNQSKGNSLFRAIDVFLEMLKLWFKVRVLRKLYLAYEDSIS